MSSRFTKGSLWELTIDANCIPGGRYTFREAQDELLIFGVGSSISFGLARDFYTPFLRPVRDTTAERTSATTFINKYADLYRSQSLPKVAASGFTFCVMDQRLRKRFSTLVRLTGRRYH